MNAARLRYWQLATAGVLLLGYAGYYVCRSNLAVAAPSILAEFGPAGLDKRRLGAILSAGVLAYAVGKVANGVIGDFIGGKALFVAGMLLSVAATVAFGVAHAIPLLAVAWIANRYVQAGGWGALVKVASRWFGAARYGTVMGVLSQSYLFGAALGRLWLAHLLGRGFGWRRLFFDAAAALFAVAALTFAVLRGSPLEVGLPEPEVAAENVYGAEGAGARPRGLLDLLMPYLQRADFAIVCLASFGLTLVRETFNAWTPTYLVEVFGASPAEAAHRSALFPLAGGLSVLVVGALSDRVGRGRRLVAAAPLLAAASVALMALAHLGRDARPALALSLLAAVAFLVIGPYSLLAGAVALDLGGRRGSATAAGLIDSAGYVGAMVSGYAVGAIAESAGWARAMGLLALVTAVTAAVAVGHRVRGTGVGAVGTQAWQSEDAEQ